MSIALIVLAVILVLLIVLLFATVKIAREYERGVIFRLGRLLPEPKGPGLFLLIPVIDRMEKVDLRTVTLNVPPQEVITKDNVPVRVNAVAYFRIVEPKAAIVQVENYMVATSQISDDAPLRARAACSTSSSRAGQDQPDPSRSSTRRRRRGDQGLDRRGQGRRDPGDMQRAMARQAEGARAAREGHLGGGRVPGLGAPQGRGCGDGPGADHRPAPLSQTLLEIGATNNSTIVFPIPIEFLETLGLHRFGRRRVRTLVAVVVVGLVLATLRRRPCGVRRVAWPHGGEDVARTTVQTVVEGLIVLAAFVVGVVIVVAVAD